MAKNADGDRRIRVALHVQARHGREEVAGLLAREEIKAVLAEASEAVLDGAHWMKTKDKETGCPRRSIRGCTDKTISLI